MKESYPDDIMLCFVQGFGDGDRERNNNKTRELERSESNGTRLSKWREQRKLRVHIENLESNAAAELSSKDTTPDVIGEPVEIRPRKSQSIVGRSLRLSSADRLLHCLPDVKRSFSDRFSVVNDANGKRPTKGILTIRKTW